MAEMMAMVATALGTAASSAGASTVGSALYGFGQGMAGTIAGAGAGTAVTAGATAAKLIPTVGTALKAASVAGSGLQAYGQYQEGKVADQQAQAAAGGMRQEGDQKYAEAQREGLQRIRERDLALSRFRAVSGSDGYLTDDVSNIMTGVHAQGTYNQLAELFSGRSQQNRFYTQAGATSATGRSKRQAGKMAAFGTVYDAYKRYT
jgi:hypothetical protein